MQLPLLLIQQPKTARSALDPFADSAKVPEFVQQLTAEISACITSFVGPLANKCEGNRLNRDQADQVPQERQQGDVLMY